MIGRLRPYLTLLQKKASGELPTTAQWIRNYVRTHPSTQVMQFKSPPIPSCPPHFFAVPISITTFSSRFDKAHVPPLLHMPSLTCTHTQTLTLTRYTSSHVRTYTYSHTGDGKVPSSVANDLLMMCDDIGMGRVQRPDLVGKPSKTKHYSDTICDCSDSL